MVSILFELLTSKKTVLSLIRVEKKISLKLGVQGIKRSGSFALLSKMCRTLASRSSQGFFLRKTIFSKIFQVPKNSVFQ
jgi:hypothetical protein